MPQVQSIEKTKNLLMQLINAYKMLQIYPSLNPIPQNAISQLYQTLQEILEEKGALYFKFSRNQIIEGGNIILENASGEERYKNFINKVLEHSISSIMIFPGVTRTELLTFLTLLTRDKEETEKEEGFSASLRKADVSHITVNEIPKEVEFSEKGDAEDVYKAEKTRESDILEILSSILLKEDFTEEELKLIGHLLSKPKDLRSVLFHISQKGDNKYESASLLESAVLNLKNIIDKTPGFSAPEKENLISAVITLPSRISGKLIVELIFSAVRNITAKNFLEDISPEQLSNLIMKAHDEDIARVEKVSLALNNISFRTDYKDALQSFIKQGLIERGYSKEEAEVIIDNRETVLEDEETKVKEGFFTSITKEDKESYSLSIEEVAETNADAQVLQYLQFEARKFRSDSHLFRCLLSLIYYAENDKVLEEIEKNINVLLASLIEDNEFSLISETISFLKNLIKCEAENPKKVEFAKKILNEIYLEKHIYQIFERIANSAPESSNYQQAKNLLNNYPVDFAISALIKILSTEEMLSRRKLLISLIADIGKDHPEIIGARVSSESGKWFVVRNICTILGMIKKPEAIPYLKEALQHPDIRVKKEAVKALSQIGGTEAFQAIMEYCTNVDTEFRRFILRNIGNTGCREALEILLPLVEKRDFFLRDYEDKIAAIESLSKLRFPESRKALEKLSNTRSLFFRKKARAISEAAKNALRAFLAGGQEVASQ